MITGYPKEKVYNYDLPSQLLKQPIYVIARKRLQSKSEGQQSKKPPLFLYSA
jgi:hypothetical protein